MKKSYRICYGSEHQDIDAVTLVASLLNINTALNDINNYLNQIEGTERKINIRVKGTSPGSFNLDVTITQSIVSAITALWTNGGIEYLLTCFAAVTQLIQFLEGRNPKKVEHKGSEISIVNHNGRCTVIKAKEFNLYMNCQKARASIAKNNELLSDDPDVKDFSLCDGPTHLLTVSKEEMVKATSAPELTDDESIRDIYDTTWMKAIRLSYNPDHKWTFVYKGNQINAKIEDDAFWGRVENNEKFSKGDSFKVILRIRQVKDISLGAWFNRDYCVQEVIEHSVKEDDQGMIGFHNEEQPN